MESRGVIQIADQVVAVIAGIAANEVPGVSTMASGLYEDLTKKISRKTAARGVDVSIVEDETIIDLRITVRFGVRIDRACRMVQEKVKEEVEGLTGLIVREVNVRVEGIMLRQETNVPERV